MSPVNAASRQQADQKANILLMEDETNVAKGLKLVLAEEGYQVDWAQSGAHALKLFREKHYDLLLADLRLPDMDGIEVIKAVRGNQPQTGVIVITGYASVNSAVEAMKLGASDYLQKPFTDDEIRGVVQETLVSEASSRPASQAEPQPDDPEALMVQKREVYRVLNRTAEDREFWNDLMEMRTEVLDDYKLSPEAKSAILRGDFQWIIDNVGGLTQKQLLFLFQRQRDEVWLH